MRAAARVRPLHLLLAMSAVPVLAGLVRLGQLALTQPLADPVFPCAHAGCVACAVLDYIQRGRRLSGELSGADDDACTASPPGLARDVVMTGAWLVNLAVAEWTLRRASTTPATRACRR